jgi:hypothetical protein
MKQISKKHISSIINIKDDTLYLEVEKNGRKSIETRIKEGNYFERNEKSIKEGFNFGNGTIKDYEQYADNNCKYADFIQLI